MITAFKEAIIVSYQWLKQVGILVPPALPGCRSNARSYRLSPGVTSRGSHGRLIQDIYAAMAAAIAIAFDIPIVDRLTYRTLPLGNVPRYRSHDSATCGAGLGRRIPTTDFFHRTTIPIPLVRQHVDECGPRSIADRFCQLGMRHHALDIPVFQSNEAVFCHQLPAQLLMKVAALIGNVLIQTCQAPARPATGCDFPASSGIVDGQGVAASAVPLGLTLKNL
jgi:hypothetical protein